MTGEDPTPQEDFDLLVALLADRMAEYLACLQAIPSVTGTAKAELWFLAIKKRDEMDRLHQRLDDSRSRLAATAPEKPTRAAQILLDACRALSWRVGAHTEARSLIYECRQHVARIANPVARNCALEWLRRALEYAELGRRTPAIQCMNNAAVELRSE